MIISISKSLFCLINAVSLPSVLVGSSVYFRIKQFGSVDIKQSRNYGVQLRRERGRAIAAQLNVWESLFVFAAALFVANISAVDTLTIGQMSVVFIGARVLHAIFYFADLALLRSLSFVVGFTSCIYLFVVALF